MFTKQKYGPHTENTGRFTHVISYQNENAEANVRKSTEV